MRAASTVAPGSEDEAAFGQALDALLRALALAMVADGEGARRIGRVLVRGGDALAAERVARGVADSPLVKTALFGGDPNWGRIAQAIGAAMPGSAPLRFEIAIEGSPSLVTARSPGSTPPSSPPRWRGMRCCMRSACRARAARPSCSSPISATTT